MVKRTNRTYSPEFKIKLLREHLIDKAPVSSLCEKHQVKPSLFYKWQNDLFGNGDVVFKNAKADKLHSHYQKQVLTLQKKLANKNEVLAELMQDYVNLTSVLSKRNISN